MLSEECRRARRGDRGSAAAREAADTGGVKGWLLPFNFGNYPILAISAISGTPPPTRQLGFQSTYTISSQAIPNWRRVQRFCFPITRDSGDDGDSRASRGHPSPYPSTRIPKHLP
jgi:hypothetical protein